MPNIDYAQVGDYMLPMISLSDPPDAELLAKYGMMRKKCLKHHRPILYSQLVLSEKLYPHCREVQQSAEIRLGITMEKLTKGNPPPDKSDRGLQWTAYTNTLHNIAVESVMEELVYDSGSN